MGINKVSSGVHNDCLNVLILTKGLVELYLLYMRAIPNRMSSFTVKIKLSPSMQHVVIIFYYSQGTACKVFYLH